MGIAEEGMNEWLYPESLKLSKEELEKVYDTQGKKVSGMSDSNRLLYYVYSRMMTHKGGNFNEFTLLDNPWFPRLLSQQPINPGQLISLELHRWMVNNKAGSIPYPTIIAFLLEKNLIKATSTEEEENVKCLPVSAINISKMKIKYLKKAKATRSSSQAGSASHTSVPSVSGAGDQEVDSHPGPSRAPRLSVAQRTMMAELREEIIQRLPETLLAPLRAEYDGALQQQGQRIQGIEDRLGRVEAKLDLIINHFHIPQPQGNLPPPPPPQND